MSKDYIQIYSLTDIIKRYQHKLTDNRLAIFDIGPRQNQYFILNRPYQFTTFGLIIVTGGECEITINLEPQVVKKDDMLVILSSQFFEIKQFTDDFAVKAIFIDADLFLEAGFHIKSHNLLNFLSSQYPKVITLQKKIRIEVTTILKRLNHLIYSKEHLFAKPLILHYFSILMYELGNYYTKSQAQSIGKRQRKEEIAKNFLFLVSSNFKKQRSVQFYADTMFISRKHLTKIVTDTFQKTPKQIISESIILEAKVLLKNPAITISEIISILNFPDASMFSKFFKNHTNMSPTEFKNLH
ncbi:helix-turn-helix domain-containing protein [Myroides injenensis]|uniref:helix-turn-helix domain-containing protein n=1 Tax=Myroides injenensis TaxID=1183151 RepID=UPI0002893B0E|nr:helix-turn-helix domain-containing protein [Myroides injenensis]